MPIDLNSMRNPPSIQARADAGLKEYFRSIYTYMTLALALTGLVAWFAYDSGFYAQIARTPLIWAVVFAPFALVLLLGFGIQKMSLGAAQAVYWVYSALMGLSLAGIFYRYSGQSIAQVFFITAGTFGGMSVYGMVTKTDLTRMGNFMIMGLFGIIIASLVNMFMHSSALQFAVSVIGVIVFTGLTAYDTQKLKEMYYQVGQSDMRGKAIIMGALELYLDFVNLFIMLLRLFGDRRN
jgi:uncharacterized protein